MRWSYDTICWLLYQLNELFVLSFDSEYVQYMDREDKKVYQEKDLSDFETAMTNDDSSQSFEGYLDYMDRKMRYSLNQN